VSTPRVARAYADPYLAGAGLGMVLLAAFVLVGRGLGASGAFASTAAGAVAAVAPQSAAASPLFAHYLEGQGPWLEWLSFELAGVVLGAALSAALAGRLRVAVDRPASIANGTRLACAFGGGAAMAVGAALMVGYTFIDAHTPLLVLGLMMAVFGVSMGLQFQVLMVAIQAAAPLADIGAATGLITQARTVGASLGLAVNGAGDAIAALFKDKALPTDAAAALPEGLTGLSPHLAGSLPEATRDVVLSHYTAGVNVMFLWVAALYFVAMLLTILLKDVRIPKRA